MAYLAAVSAGSGVPLFIRTRGDVPQLSFPVVAALNGAHFFTSNASCTLRSCCSGDVRTAWKCFSDCITLIVMMADDSPSDTQLQYLLELVFNSMVLLVGLDQLVIGDVEKMKRELKCCYPLIDHLLAGGGDLMCTLTQCTDVAVHQDTTSLAECLESFTEALQTGYCCVTVGGNLLLATESWWQLTTTELNLLLLLHSSLPPAQCHDVPVYLPSASPNVAHRLLIFSLVADIELVVLCDAEPSLQTAQQLVRQFWSIVGDSLTELAQAHRHSLAHRLSLDPAILGFSLVNLENRRCVSFTQDSEDQGERYTLLSAGYQGAVSQVERRRYLKQFYNTVAGNLLPTTLPLSLSHDNDDQSASASEPHPHHEGVTHRIPHKINETYMCTQHFKAYAVHRDQYNLFVLYGMTTPTYALRRMSNELLDSIVWKRVLH